MRDSQTIGRGRLHVLAEVLSETAEDMQSERQRMERLKGESAKPAVFSSFNLFQTPPDLADKVIEIAGIRSFDKVLEPSAGLGRLIDAIARKNLNGVRVTAVEIDGPIWHRLSDSQYALWVTSRNKDFLQWDGSDGPFDRIVMNPPFKMGADIKHIMHALTMLKPGGRLVSICANGPRQQAKLKPIADEWIELPAGSFRCEGTALETAIFVKG